jgi:hypothetical protein
VPRAKARAGLVGDLARGGRGEELRLVHHHQHRIPERAVGIEQPAEEGRKRGLAGIIATQRLAKLAKNVAAEASNFLMGRTFLDIDMARAADLLGLDRRGAEMFRDLARGHWQRPGLFLGRRRHDQGARLLTHGGQGEQIGGGVAALGHRRTMTASAEEEARPLPVPRPKPVRAPGPDVLVQLANYRPPVRDDLPEEE